MSDHPIDPRDVLISLATAALTAAEADAGAPGAELVFRPEWRPTPRARSSTCRPQGIPAANQSSSWLSFTRNELSRYGQLQEDQPLVAPDAHAKRTLPSPYASPPVSTSVPPPPPALSKDAVAELLKKNQDVFNEVINHPFPQALDKGLQSPTPFQIIPDGTYSIHISCVESVVLTIQNVKGFLRPPLDKLLGGYFPSDAGSSVVGMKKTVGDNERWHAVATKAEYTFRNLGTGLYLGISTEVDRKDGRVLKAILDPYYWWINPVSSQGSPAYRIHDSKNLRYTLHGDLDVLSNIGSNDFIIAHENSEVSCQMWSFNDKLERTQLYPADHKCAENIKSELAERLHQAQTINAGLETERSNYIRENDLLRQELEQVRLTKLGAQAAKGPLDEKNVLLPIPSAEKSEVVFIAVMGIGKSGKSTFINLATRSKNLRVGLSGDSCTGAVEAARPLELDGRQVVLLDTPGFDHSHKSDVEVLRNIALELETKYRQGIKLHEIIYLYRISDVRVSNAAEQDFLGLRRLCGNKSDRNIVILTNMWDRVNAEIGRRGAGDLQFLDDLFTPALEEGARLMHHTDGTVDLVHTIVRSMIRNALAIQEELVDKDMDIDQTSVGKEVDRWMAERIEGYEEQEDELWDSTEQARRDGDEKTRSGLLAELQNVRAKTAKLEKERAGQARDYKRHRQLNQTPAGTP
ncbi:hypothetical protein K438DRAFT_1998216 [Mycena galopus ATCC 62051]|nr:hypothetical protein K438DRAFT_1998216 [Mycena galopus ATCC 62051]